jgi:hypothetical protein
MAIYECETCDQYAEHFECQECFNDSRCQYCYVCDEACDDLTEEQIRDYKRQETLQAIVRESHKLFGSN